MANIFNRIAGTSEHSFRIGLGGFTFYTGTTDPNVTPPTPNSFGFGDGDIYTRTLSGSVSVYVYDGGVWNPVFGVGGVDSFNTRTGAVLPILGDYDADIVAFDPSGVTLTATHVQDALEQLDARWVALGGPFLPLTGGTLTGDLTMDNAAQILADGGSTAANPAYAFDTDDQSGLHSPASGELELVTSSAPRLKIDGSGRITAETANYETLVDADDVIPNKLYVDTRPIPYDLAMFIGGAMAAADNIVGGMVMTRGVRIEINGGPDSRAYCLTPDGSASTVYTLHKNENVVPFGTVTFPAATNVGSIVIASATEFAVGERLTVMTPSVTTNIEDVMITIVGCAPSASCTPP